MPGRSAQPREEVAKVVQRLRMDELAERLVDQGDVRFAEQMVDVLRRAKDDPVERQLEQISRRPERARPSSRAARPSSSAWSSCTSSIGPPADSSVTIAANSRGAREKLCAIETVRRTAEHPVEDRVDVLEMIVEVEQRLELGRRTGAR